jgi:hypothetical protein
MSFCFGIRIAKFAASSGLPFPWYLATCGKVQSGSVRMTLREFPQSPCSQRIGSGSSRSERVSLEVILRGTCDRTRLLDLMELVKKEQFHPNGNFHHPVKHSKGLK